MDNQLSPEKLQKLQEANSLLLDVHIQLGVYGYGKIYPETLAKINEFFEFDGSKDID